MGQLSKLLATAIALTSTASAQTLAFPAELVGTWSTKSNMTLTGPGFYDPQKDELIEPARTGISYSFTADGFYEEAYYRAIANPVNPNCPGGIMQWQHGSATYNTDGTMTLNPIVADGRQLLSQPCNGDNAIYSRYNQTETIKTFAQYLDPYHKIARLDLFQFDGSPLPPMYLAYSPPEMLPTTTLTQPKTSNTAAAKSSNKLRKRSTSQTSPTLSRALQSHAMDPDLWWWAGLTMTGIGGLLYFGPRRMGISI